MGKSVLLFGVETTGPGKSAWQGQKNEKEIQHETTYVILYWQ